MSDPGPRFWEIFFEVYENLPRQGPGNLAAIARGGFELLGHFPLPDEAWWDDFYTPMEARIAELRGKYARDPEATGILDRLADEPRLHRRYSDFYAYEFFVTRRPPAAIGDRSGTPDAGVAGRAG